ncbi:MAG TPA: FAD-dependent oxidoreductase [Albitalea sp.]|uniref:flavin monoamine oxidase family protein n=1 Tax=Piscinibacter sp. TaxID=1903157 RepID=UPI002ED30A28
MPSRRGWLRAVAAAPLVSLAGCERTPELRFDGGWVGADVERGHRLRDPASLPAPAVQRRAGVLVVGAGVAGLACARALVRAGLDDVQLVELEDRPGGNSRGHRIAGMDCPLGAHYLPLPDESAGDLVELLEDLGLRRTEHGRPVYDERHLCHSPQERLFIAGQWHDGLLPPTGALPAAEQAPTLAQYQRFAARVAELGRDQAFALPTARSAWRSELDALDATTFARWLDAEGFTAPPLRWYLDYCCRDDYGGGAAEVSAWAGVHYFASRHGFHAPQAQGEEREGVLTWPQGNAWLVERLAAPLAQRLHAARIALRVTESRHQVDVDLWHDAEQRIERWTAPRVVLATPLFVARRLLAAAPPALVDAAARLRHAPWLVANLHLDEPLADRPGAPPSWDNVLYGSAGLGYVDAMHQSTRPHPGPTVLTAYRSWGADPAHRRELLALPWAQRAAQVLQELAPAHPDLARKVRRIDLMRYGHAMSIPVPGVRSSAALRALAASEGRVLFAHADLSGYSVFEEAYAQGLRAARTILKTDKGRRST